MVEDASARGRRPDIHPLIISPPLPSQSSTRLEKNKRNETPLAGGGGSHGDEKTYLPVIPIRMQGQTCVETNPSECPSQPPQRQHPNLQPLSPRLLYKTIRAPNLPPPPRLLHPPHRGRRSATLREHRHCQRQGDSAFRAKKWRFRFLSQKVEVPLFEPKGGEHLWARKRALWPSLEARRGQVTRPTWSTTPPHTRAPPLAHPPPYTPHSHTHYSPPSGAMWMILPFAVYTLARV